MFWFGTAVDLFFSRTGVDPIFGDPSSVCYARYVTYIAGAMLHSG
ncbi:hypothetical protein HMPREF0293_1451 [Corynebacterium glucuronolyticum ATCC 51866]|uniref:Uncharacterized protein n=1 Tax=Corynebacterium glucuronolyticum ATCC 51866 TaxID=548478 RepID=A0ABP2DWI0_9CORY|nr:hypothetical protein HMPREF0293_1451 [Corynebacterium glucuronolyticum ATCC 51866]